MDNRTSKLFNALQKHAAPEGAQGRSAVFPEDEKKIRERLDYDRRIRKAHEVGRAYDKKMAGTSVSSGGTVYNPAVVNPAVAKERRHRSMGWRPANQQEVGEAEFVPSQEKGGSYPGENNMDNRMSKLFAALQKQAAPKGAQGKSVTGGVATGFTQEQIEAESFKRSRAAAERGRKERAEQAAAAAAAAAAEEKRKAEEAAAKRKAAQEARRAAEAKGTRKAIGQSSVRAAQALPSVKGTRKQMDEAAEKRLDVLRAGVGARRAVNTRYGQEKGGSYKWAGYASNRDNLKEYLRQIVS